MGHTCRWRFSPYYWRKYNRSPIDIKEQEYLGYGKKQGLAFSLPSRRGRLAISVRLKIGCFRLTLNGGYLPTPTRGAASFTESPKTTRRKYTIFLGNLLYPLKGKTDYPLQSNDPYTTFFLWLSIKQHILLRLKSYNALYYKGLIKYKNRPWKGVKSLFKVCCYSFIKFLLDKTVCLAENNLSYPKTFSSIPSRLFHIYFWCEIVVNSVFLFFIFLEIPSFSCAF